MSAELTSAARPVALPPWLTLDLASTPQTPEALAEELQRALSGVLPPGARAELHLQGGAIAPSGWTVNELSAVVRSGSMAQLPTAPPPPPEPLPGAAVTPIGLERARVLLDGPVVRGLRFHSVEVDLAGLRGELASAGACARLTLRSAEQARLRCTLTAPDVEAFLRVQTPWLREVSVRFEPGARLVARARVSLGLIAIPGEAHGRVTVEEGARLVLADVQALLANGRPAPHAVAERIRAANPLVDLSPLRAAGWPLRLEEPVEREGRLILTGVGG